MVRASLEATYAGESEPKRFGSTPDQVRFSPSQGSTRASERLPAGKQWRGRGSASAAGERGAIRGERGEEKEAFPHTKWRRRRGAGAPGGAPPAPRRRGLRARAGGRLGPAPRPSTPGGRSRARAAHSPRTRSRSRGRRRSRGMNGAAAARPRLAARCGRLPLALARAPAARGRSAAAPRALRGVTHSRRSAWSLCSAPRPPRIPPPAPRGPSSAPGRRPASLRAWRRGRCGLGQPGGAGRPPPRHPRPSLRPVRRHQAERDAPAQGSGSVLKSDLGLDTKIGAGKLRGLRR